MSLYPDVQEKLRAELAASSAGEEPSMDELNGFTYLDAVIREVLRLYTPVPMMRRHVDKDDVIPTEFEWTDRHGTTRKGIP